MLASGPLAALSPPLSSGHPLPVLYSSQGSSPSPQLGRLPDLLSQVWLTFLCHLGSPENPRAPCGLGGALNLLYFWTLFTCRPPGTDVLELKKLTG